MPASSTVDLTIKKVTASAITVSNDILASEEPLEICLEYGTDDQRVKKTISVTMRTPGNDVELAAGFLFTEGIIGSKDELELLPQKKIADENSLTISLKPSVSIRLAKLERHFYTSSSCGVCGKTSIEAIKTVCRLNDAKNEKQYRASLIHQLPTILGNSQPVFEQTGGLHAAAIFNSEGELLLVREDVGRHNALDKLIGTALLAGMLPLSDPILLLSGRASFELIQKAAMAGIKMVAAVGAPSGLAVETAASFDITLIGFLRNERFNIYSGAQRIVI